jgi:hypothetical protein
MRLIKTSTTLREIAMDIVQVFRRNFFTVCLTLQQVQRARSIFILRNPFIRQILQ